MRNRFYFSCVGLLFGWTSPTFAQDSNASLIDQLNSKTKNAQEQHMERRGEDVRRWCGQNLECFSGRNSDPVDEYHKPSDSFTSSSSSKSTSSSHNSNNLKNTHGVRRIESNGKIGSSPSNAITCLSGSRHIVYKKNGTWYTGGGGHMGNKFNSWSVEEIAREKCR